MALTYDPIATTTLGSNQNSVTFSSIPATYTDLIVVLNYQCSDWGASTFIQFNGDTTTNYSDTWLSGASSATSGRDSTFAQIRVGCYAGGVESNTQRFDIAQIFDYANTTTFKTVLSRTNLPVASSYGASEVGASVGLWRKTPEAINSIRLFFGGGTVTFKSGSTFKLYGIEAGNL